MIKPSFLSSAALLLLAAALLNGQAEPETSFLREPLVCRLLADGEADRAIEILVPEGERTPENLNIKLYLAYAYRLKKDAESSARELQAIRTEVDKMRPSARPMGDPEMFLMMGMDRRSQAFLDKDKEGYFHFFLGLTLKAGRDFKNAEKAFRKAQGSGFDRAAVALSLVDLYLSMDNAKSASRELDEFKKLSGPTPLVAFYEAYHAHKRGRDEDALAAFEKLGAEIPEAEKNAAYLNYNLGRYVRALDIWVEILSKTPEDPEALLNAGRAAWRAGSADQAREFFDRAGITIAPANYSPAKVALLSRPDSAEPELKPPCAL